MEGFFLLMFTIVTHCGSDLDWFWVIQDTTIISSCVNYFFFLWSNAWKEPTYKRKSLLRLTTWRDNLPWLVAGAKNVQVGRCYHTSRPAPTNVFSLVPSRGSTSSKQHHHLWPTIQIHESMGSTSHSNHNSPCMTNAVAFWQSIWIKYEGSFVTLLVSSLL